MLLPYVSISMHGFLGVAISQDLPGTESASSNDVQRLRYFNATNVLKSKPKVDMSIAGWPGGRGVPGGGAAVAAVSGVRHRAEAGGGAPRQHLLR